MTANSKGPREDLGKGESGEVVTGELPKDLTVAETIDWVSGDKAKAKIAIEAEEKRLNTFQDGHDQQPRLLSVRRKQERAGA